VRKSALCPDLTTSFAEWRCHCGRRGKPLCNRLENTRSYALTVRAKVSRNRGARLRAGVWGFSHAKSEWGAASGVSPNLALLLRSLNPVAPGRALRLALRIVLPSARITGETGAS
jgi:hypothetical protein